MTKKTWTQITGLACGLVLLSAPGRAEDNTALRQLKDMAGPEAALPSVKEPSSRPVSIDNDSGNCCAPAQSELIPFDTGGYGGQYYPEPAVYANAMRYWLRELTNQMEGVQLNRLETYFSPSTNGTYVGMRGSFSVIRPKEPRKGDQKEYSTALKADPFNDDYANPARLSSFACEAYRHYITKIMETLAANGLITSYKVTAVAGWPIIAVNYFR